MDPILVLQNSSESITAVLAGAITTTNPIYSVMWNGDGGPANPVGALTGATAKTLLTGSGPKYVESLQIYNADSASITVTLAKVVNGTSYNLLQRVLATGDTPALAGPLARITVAPWWNCCTWFILFCCKLYCSNVLTWF